MEYGGGMNPRYTTKNPYVHDYNPLTHLRGAQASSQAYGGSDMRSSNSVFGQFTKPSEGLAFSPTKRLAKSLPRSVYADPLTGRVIDFSSPQARSTFASSAALSLNTRTTDFPMPIDTNPRLAKTRIRSEMFDPITGTKVAVQINRHPVESLDVRPRIDNPFRLKAELRAAPASSSGALEVSPESSIAGSRRRKADSLAYVNPFQI